MSLTIQEIKQSYPSIGRPQIIPSQGELVGGRIIEIFPEFGCYIELTQFSRKARIIWKNYTKNKKFNPRKLKLGSEDIFRVDTIGENIELSRIGIDEADVKDMFNKIEQSKIVHTMFSEYAFAQNITLETVYQTIGYPLLVESTLTIYDGIKNNSLRRDNNSILDKLLEKHFPISTVFKIRKKIKLFSTDGSGIDILKLVIRSTLEEVRYTFPGIVVDILYEASPEYVLYVEYTDEAVVDVIMDLLKQNGEKYKTIVI